MPRRYPQEIRRQVLELARSGTCIAQLSQTFGMTETTICNWARQDKIDRGEIDGLRTDQALELAAAKKRIRQLETELAVARQRDLSRSGSGPKELFPVIEALTGQGINVRHASRVLGSLSRAITPGETSGRRDR